MVYVPYSCSSVPCFGLLSPLQLQLRQQHHTVILIVLSALYNVLMTGMLPNKLMNMYKHKRQDQEQTCKAKVSVARRPAVSQTTPGSSAAPSLVEGAGSSSSASAIFPPYLTTILPFAGNGLLTSGSTACMSHSKMQFSLQLSTVSADKGCCQVAGQLAAPSTQSKRHNCRLTSAFQDAMECDDVGHGSLPVGGVASLALVRRLQLQW